MRENTGHAGLRPQDETTVCLPRGARPGAPAEGVTVCVPGAMLAPARAVMEAGDAPVFVDDSGGRRRLLRLAGVLVALLSVSFLAVVGVALAVPSVATSVGLGDVVPFIVPGAAAPPPPKAPPAPVQQVRPRPVVVVAPRPRPRPVVVTPPTTRPAPTSSPAPVTEAPVTKAPETKAPETKAPETEAPETKAPGTADPKPPVVVDPPVDPKPPVAVDPPVDPKPPVVVDLPVPAPPAVAEPPADQ